MCMKNQFAAILNEFLRPDSGDMNWYGSTEFNRSILMCIVLRVHSKLNQENPISAYQSCLWSSGITTKHHHYLATVRK